MTIPFFVFKEILINMNCGCNNNRIITPDCDMSRWEVQCSSYIQDADNYYTKKEVDDLIEGASGCCITPEEVDEKIESATSGLQETLVAGDNIIISGNVISAEVPSLSGYATDEWVEQQGYLKTVEPLKTINGETLIGEGNIVITGSSVTVDDHLDGTSTNPVQNKVIVGALNDKLDASAYTPTDLSNYYTTAQTDSKISEAVSGKQDTLIAGENISISGNVISSQGGGKAIEAGRGISIATGETADTVSFSLPISAGTGVGSLVLMIETNEASGRYAYAEGVNTKAIGNYTHTEGNQTTASGSSSHSEGQYTKASGESSHAEGSQTEAYGQYSHTEGENTRTFNKAEHSSGAYNLSNSATTTFGDSGNTLFSVGNGRNSGGWPIVIDRHNALDIRQNGDIYIADTSGSGEYYEKPMIKLQDHLGGGGSGVTSGEVQTMIDNSISGKADSSDVYNKTDVYNKNEVNNLISAKPNVWCGSESEWSQISGSTVSGTIYLVY